MKTPLTIHDYHGNMYLVNLEEDFKDILYAIKYEDHGDEFVIVYVKDDTVFTYGWWDDRYHFGDYIREHELFAKKVPQYENPFVFGNVYKWNIPERIEYWTDLKNYFGDPKEDSEYREYILSRFNDIIEKLSIAYDTGYEYDWLSLKEKTIKFLKECNLYSRYNRHRCKTARWTSKRVKGCIGIAAKENWTKHYQFSCDKILSTWYNGEWHDSTYHKDDKFKEWPISYRKLPYKEVGPDKWGIYSYVYNFQDIKNHLTQMVLFD